MFPRTNKLVCNFGVPIKFFLLSKSIKLKLLALPARMQVIEKYPDVFRFGYLRTSNGTQFIPSLPDQPRLTQVNFSKPK